MTDLDCPPAIDEAATVEAATVEAEVANCFADYEAALIAGDVETMNSWFVDDDRVVRFGLTDEQDGVAAIRTWRQAAARVPPGRQLLGTRIVAWGRDVVVVSTLFRYPRTGMVGRQSQTWVRTESGWRIAHAHVSDRQAEA